MGASRTMQLAQKLYEAGHITYMRTDGINISPQAVHTLRSAVQSKFGDEYVPEKPRMYTSRSKNAQEAHEAIRPTNPSTSLETLSAAGFEPQAVKLYKLILARALASQMANARLQNAAADFVSADGLLTLRSTSSRVAFPGYLGAYGVDLSPETEEYEAEAGGEDDLEGLFVCLFLGFRMFE